MKWFLLLLLSCNALAADLKVVVLDTGLNLTDPRFAPYLCKDGHKDFTGEGIEDYNGHGTHVVGNIIQNAGSVGYCLIILKYYGLNPNYNNYNEAFAEIVKISPKFVNYSGGGTEPNPMEKMIIEALNEIIFVVAAGNENQDISINKYYPASYGFSNIVVVGGLDNNGYKSTTSNYGSLVKAWEIGDNVLSTCLNGNCKKSGTSMSTATHCGKLIKSYVKTH